MECHEGESVIVLRVIRRCEGEGAVCIRLGFVSEVPVGIKPIALFGCDADEQTGDGLPVFCINEFAVKGRDRSLCWFLGIKGEDGRERCTDEVGA